jgi:nucleotide-binding universal stress UspA family protein
MRASVLIGLDPWSEDRAPVRFGAAVSRFTGAPLTVVSVDAASEAMGPVGRGQDDAGQPTGEVARRLAQVASELRALGIAAECRVLGGASVPAGLHAAAESLHAGMIVVGATQRGELGRALAGSTADRLLHGAPCPVAVVPDGWEAGGGLHTLAVAFVDTPEGREALDSALALARRAGVRPRVLVAVEPRRFGRAEGGRPGHEATTFDASGADVDAASRRVREVAAGIAPDVEVEVDASVQDAAEFLVAASERVDLLICGSRGYGPKRAVLLGGVSRRVTAEAACPVVVLARGTEVGLRPLVEEDAALAART